MNTELFFQTVHSVNLLSFYGAVANWCEHVGLTEAEKRRNNVSVNKSFLTSVPPQELQLLVSPPTMASGSSLQEHTLNFEALSYQVQFTRLSEDVCFKHRVSAEMKYKTRPDENDGYGTYWRFYRR